MSSRRSSWRGSAVLFGAAHGCVPRGEVRLALQRCRRQPLLDLRVVVRAEAGPHGRRSTARNWFISVSARPSATRSVKVCAEAEDRLLAATVHPAGERGDRPVRRGRCCKSSAHTSRSMRRDRQRTARRAGAMRSSQGPRGIAQAVVPPHSDGVALDQLEEALQDRLLERIAGGVAVGVRGADTRRRRRGSRSSSKR